VRVFNLTCSVRRVALGSYFAAGGGGAARSAAQAPSSRRLWDCGDAAALDRRGAPCGGAREINANLLPPTTTPSHRIPSSVTKSITRLRGEDSPRRAVAAQQSKGLRLGQGVAAKLRGTSNLSHHKPHRGWRSTLNSGAGAAQNGDGFRGTGDVFGAVPARVAWV